MTDSEHSSHQLSADGDSVQVIAGRWGLKAESFFP
jgi:hypothetical protein